MCPRPLMRLNLTSIYEYIDTNDVHFSSSNIFYFNRVCECKIHMTQNNACFRYHKTSIQRNYDTNPFGFESMIGKKKTHRINKLTINNAKWLTLNSSFVFELFQCTFRSETWAEKNTEDEKRRMKGIRHPADILYLSQSYLSVIRYIGK